MDLLRIFLLACMLGAGATLAACESDGSLENAGEAADDAAEDAGDAVDDAVN